MPKLVCVPCQRQYRFVKKGNCVVEMFQHPPEPHKILSGDRWQCPGCGHQIIAGFAQSPLAEHYQDGFQGKLDEVLEDKNTIHCF